MHKSASQQAPAGIGISDLFLLPRLGVHEELAFAANWPGLIGVPIRKYYRMTRPCVDHASADCLKVDTAITLSLYLEYTWLSYSL